MTLQESLDRPKYGEIEYPADCERIQVVARQMGAAISLGLAQTIWQSYSDSRCAGWLILGDDEEIQDAITRYSELE